MWLLSPESRVGLALVRSSFDWSQGLLPEVPLQDSPVVIVYLDLNSYASEAQNPMAPWSRALHAQLVNRLTAAGAKAVVFDIIFDVASTNSEADRKFAAALRANGRVVLAGEINASDRATLQADGISTFAYSQPADLFREAAAAWGVAGMREDGDFVVRRYFAGFPAPAPPSLTAAAARLAGVPEARIANTHWLHYYGQPYRIPHLSYAAALQPDASNAAFFRDKIVFIGAGQMAGTFQERKDEFRSPLTYWGDRKLFMPAVEVQATQMLNLLRRDSLRRWPIRIEVMVQVLAAFIITGLLFSFRPLPAAGVAVGASGAVFGLAVLALRYDSTWYPWLLIVAVQIPGAFTGSVLWQSVQWYRQRRKFEAQRRVAEAKIREQAALIEKAQDAILVQDLEGRIVYANQSAERLYGWKAAELSGRTGLLPFGSAAARETALNTGEWFGELEQITREGRQLTVSSRCTLIRDETGAPRSLLFINTDVTEKKRLEREFYRAQRADSIGLLAAGMAHDLNNAFAPILMGLQLLQRQRQNPDTRRMLAVMESNTQRGAEMVRQVLLFSRGDANDRQVLALGRLLREVEQMIRQTFSKAINLAVLAPPDLWPVRGNATQIHQVLLNLCVNARDAMPDGGELTLAADNVELDGAEAGQIPQAVPGRYVMLLVADSGSGIPPELRSQIFEPFFTTKPAGHGTGLGLSTVARIVGQHGGFVQVKSEPGQGTTFEIYLPAATAVPEAGTTHIPPAASGRGQGELILVADDEQAVREMIVLTLEDQGYRVIAAANGAEAVAKFEAHAAAVRLALVDTDMPVMNGPQTVVALHAHNPQLPVVLMSGELTSEARPQVADILAKPFPLEQLLTLVRRVLETH